MTLRFVKTSILTSEDGIDFGKEVAVESEEVIAAKVAAERASSKPLYQQLAEIKEKKQQEYDENTKKIFAPPKALEVEDVEFFQELDVNKAKALEARAKRDEDDLKLFRQKVAEAPSKVINPFTTRQSDEIKIKKATPLPITITKAKRKIDAMSSSDKISASKKLPNKSVEAVEDEIKVENKSISSLLNSYSSDDED